MSVVWKPEKFSSHTTFNVTGSQRMFGVEIETASCPNYRCLKGQTVFGAKYDGSIKGLEFDSPKLYGDAGLQAISDFCGMARTLNWRIDSDCGLHLHCDMREESLAVRRRVAHAYLQTNGIWRSFVNQYRANECSYCRHNMPIPRDFFALMSSESAWESFCFDTNRYSGFNFASYPRHGSFEIRLHQGSLNSRAIAAWVRIHLQFIDKVATLNLQTISSLFNVDLPTRWVNFKRLINNSYLTRYYGRRRETRRINDYVLGGGNV